MNKCHGRDVVGTDLEIPCRQYAGKFKNFREDVEARTYHRLVMSSVRPHCADDPVSQEREESTSTGFRTLFCRPRYQLEYRRYRNMNEVSRSRVVHVCHRRLERLRIVRPMIT
jgi:hypothetical protein